MKKKRLSDKEFWSALTEAHGLYQRAARIIAEKYGFEYTRQSTRERAERQPERLTAIVESTLDIAEGKLIELFESKIERVRLNAIQFYLKSKGKGRGYVERSEVTGADGKSVNEQAPLNFAHLTDEELAVIGGILDNAKTETSPKVKSLLGNLT